MGLKIIMKNQVSPQYLREGKIFVTIIEAKSPVHYVIKESPSMNTTSTYASMFLELEESMQKYYRSLEKTFFQLPVKDTILVVEHEKKYYRAKVCSILNLPRSYLIKVFLLDYGIECSVPKSSLFEIDPDFMSVPFQVVEFKLPGLEPMSLVMNPHDLTVDYGTSIDWDPSASAFIESMRKALRNAYVKVEGAEKNCIFGTLHVTVSDGEEKCLNDELVFKKYATQNPECWNNITRLVDILSKGNLSSNPNASPSPSNNTEISACTYSKSLPARELGSPESLKSSPASAVVLEPSKNVSKSGVTKLKEILRAKKSPQKSKVMSFSEEKKEAPSQSDVEVKSVKQKDWMEIKSAPTVKVSSNGSTMQKFMELRAMKRAALKQQNVSQTSSDGSCTDSPSRIFQLEVNSPVSDSHSSESERTKKSHQDHISSTNTENVQSVSSPSGTKDSEFGKTEKSVHLPVSSATVQDVHIADKASYQKSDCAHGENSPASSEQKEVSKKVDPAAVKAFYERNKRARAKFLAENKSEQNQSNANPQVSIISSPLKPSEIETQSVSTRTKNVEPCTASKPSELDPKLVASDTKHFEKSCGDNSLINELEFVVESSDNHLKSMDSQMLAEPKEVMLKDDSRKLSTFFERNRKDRALFLAQTKSNQDQDNKSSQSEITSPFPLVHRSSEIERESSASPVSKNVEKSCGNDSQDNLLKLVDESSDSSFNR